MPPTPRDLYRQRILAVLASSPDLTAEELAGRLGKRITLAQLTRHTSYLVAHGQLKTTRSGELELRYRVAL